MKLSEIFDNAPAIEISELNFDSRIKTKQSIFFCVEGLVSDGHLYVNQAIENGAVCIVHSKDILEKQNGIVYVKVENVTASLNRIANKFYDYPSRKLKVYGVTGTNGKSTIAKIIRDVHGRFEPCGYMGTISISYGNVELPPSLTTPDTITIHRTLKEMVDYKMAAVAMEVSSHGLELGRVSTVDFDIAIFTNLTYDHLDFHGTIENYFEAKKKLFKQIKKDGVCVLNVDDPCFNELSVACEGRIVTYGITNDANYRADEIKLGTDGSVFQLIHKGTSYRVETNLVALYNIYNLLAAIAAMHEMGLELTAIINCLNSLDQIDGRLERIDEGQPFNVFVDFAHTPDGLEKVFQYAKLITKQERKIISVFGSAGKRDTKKRKVFGSIASKYCDMIILTEDDPRDEDPKAIANEIKSGIENTNNIYIENRYDAIRQAIEMANVDDTILILGKGDETFIYREAGREPYLGDHLAAKEVIKKYYLGYQEDTKR